MIKANVKLDTSKLKKLKDNLQRNIMKKAIRAGSKVMVTDLRSRVPVVSGSLKKSIASKVDSLKGSTTAYGVVGPRSKFVKMVKGKKHQPSRYAHFLEVGKFKRPFLLPAWNAKRNIYLNTVKQVIATEINNTLS